MDTRLLDLLVCPLCKGPLQHQRPPTSEHHELLCNADRLAFPVRDGIPILLEGEARDTSAAPSAAPAPQATPQRQPGMSFTVLVPARLASTRLPNKPLADIAGLPMVVRVAQQAARSAAKAVVVATDHPDILAACQRHGVQVVMTRADHSTGSDRLAEACEQLGLDGQDIVVNVQGDEPLIDPAMVDACAGLLARQTDCAMGTVAHAITDPAEFRNPNVVKLVCDARGRALYFSRAPIPWWRDTPSDGGAAGPAGLPPLRHVGLYSYRAGFLRRFPGLSASPLEQVESLEQLRVLWHGEHIAVHISPERPGPGVDTPEDLARVRALFR